MSVPSSASVSVSGSTKTLNPLAPEYHPIPPGIIQVSHPSPPPAAYHYLLPPPPQPQPPALFFSPQICTYTQSIPQHTAQQAPFSPRNPNEAAEPAPPQQVPRGCPRQRKLGFRSGRGPRGREEHFDRAVRCESGVNNLKVVRGRDNHNVRNKAGYCGQEMQKEENRHKVIPLEMEKDGGKTTVMIKNIPYDCSRKELVDLLDGFCKVENAKARHEFSGASRSGSSEQHILSAYDFLYLPVDFKTKRSRGFAFVNFTNTTTVSKFFDSFHLKKWEVVDWDKWPRKIQIVYARIQGKEALVKHLSDCIFECESNEFLPVCFSPARDGSVGKKPIRVTLVGKRSSNRQ